MDEHDPTPDPISKRISTFLLFIEMKPTNAHRICLSENRYVCHRSVNTQRGTFEYGIILFLWLRSSILIGLVKLMIGLSAQTSMRARNFRKVGLSYNFWSGAFVTGKARPLSTLFCVAYVLFIAPLFSLAFKWCRDHGVLFRR